MKIERILIFVAIFSILFNLAKNILVILHLIQPDSTYTILLSVASIFLLSFVYKQKYWIIACVFMAINELVKFFVRDFFTKYTSIVLNESQIIPVLAIVAAMLVLGLSLIYILKFYRVKNYEQYYLFKKRK
jgi:hypothetical protein